jgi:hypothetical protein
VLSGGHAEVRAKRNSPDVAGDLYITAAASGIVAGVIEPPATGENVRISLLHRERVFEKPTGGSTSLGAGPRQQSPHT